MRNLSLTLLNIFTYLNSITARIEASSGSHNNYYEKCSECQIPNSQNVEIQELNLFQIPQFLSPGQLTSLRWKEDSKVVTPYALQIGLPEELAPTILQYCNERGITDVFKDLVVNDNPLPVGTNIKTKLKKDTNDGLEWLLQRPDKNWKSNMHWISPANSRTQEDYLQMLWRGGFEQVLTLLGETLRLQGLVAYQLTFIAVSHCETGYLHHDFSNTHGKAFNIIIPLLCSSTNEDPELLVEDYDTLENAGYKYFRNRAILFGDDAIHATAPCDYRSTGEMRMAATVYVADVDVDNVDSILENFTQEYPPNDAQFLLNKAGIHWRSNVDYSNDEGEEKEDEEEEEEEEEGGYDDEDDGYSSENVFSSIPFDVPKLNPGEMTQLKWSNSLKVVTPNAVQIGLPPKLVPTILDYCNKMGITETFAQLTTTNPLEIGTEEIRTLGNHIDWFIQRPDKHWNSNMHWISPAGKEAQEDYLKMLFEGGFKEVLETLGNTRNMDGLVAYHLTFIGVSYCSQGYLHNDFSNVDSKGFNIIIPLLSAGNDAPPELLVQDYQTWEVSGYKYQSNVAICMGDAATHATAPCDYRDSGEMRMAATVYVADVNKGNVESILEDYTQHYPPDDPELLLSLSGSHWKNTKKITKQIKKVHSYEEEKKEA